MYFDTAEGPVFRPPSEANSFILRVTIGCSHNRCTYCSMYRSVQFRVRPFAEIVTQIYRARQYRNEVRRVFLADGNALVLNTDKLLAVLKLLKETFPRLQRVSCYAAPGDILRKTSDEMNLLHANGLKLIYYGMESGDDEVLQHVNKGVTAQQSIMAGRRVVESGIKLSLMIIIGLAGKSGSRKHAFHTAAAVNAIGPQMLNALTIMLYKDSELRKEYERGDFELLSPIEIMNELYELIKKIELPTGRHCLFRSTHISNYVALAGTLPRDKDKLLHQIQTAKISLADISEWDPYNNVE